MLASTASPNPLLACKSNCLADQDNFQPAAVYIHAGTMAGRTIALIDDDEQIRASLQRLLAGFGYRSECFASGGDFLAAAGAWDCLVIDLQLGATSGLELAQHPAVQALKLPIIITSGTSNTALWKQALALQCAGYLRKPFDAKELLQALRRAGI